MLWLLGGFGAAAAAAAAAATAEDPNIKSIPVIMAFLLVTGIGAYMMAVVTDSQLNAGQSIWGSIVDCGKGLPGHGRD